MARGRWLLGGGMFGEMSAGRPVKEHEMGFDLR